MIEKGCCRDEELQQGDGGRKGQTQMHQQNPKTWPKESVVWMDSFDVGYAGKVP